MQGGVDYKPLNILHLKYLKKEMHSTRLLKVKHTNNTFWLVTQM